MDRMESLEIDAVGSPLLLDPGTSAPEGRDPEFGFLTPTRIEYGSVLVMVDHHRVSWDCLGEAGWPTDFSSDLHVPSI